MRLISHKVLDGDVDVGDFEAELPHEKLSKHPFDLEKLFLEKTSLLILVLTSDCFIKLVQFGSHSLFFPRRRRYLFAFRIKHHS